MKVSCSTVLLFALSVGALGVRVQNRTAAKTKNVTLLRTKEPAQIEEVQAAPVMVVEEIPVVQVMVVEDGSAAAADDASSDEPGALSKTCAAEMQELTSNATRTEKAKACEQNTSHVQKAMEALQKADKPAALAATTTSFRECGGLTESCAKEVAPQVVLKLRLSGAAIEEKCAKVAQEQSQKQTQSLDQEDCQKNTTTGMVQGLQHQDLDASMDAAQHGLAKCFKVEPPCDFQLAPILVMHLLEAVRQQQQQQQITEVLLTGMRAAQLAQEEEAEDSHAAKSLVMASTSATATKKVAVKAMSKVAQKVFGKGKKALSLLSVSSRVHVKLGKAAF